MSGLWAEISAGREPERELPPGRPPGGWRRPSGQSVRAWAGTHRTVVAAAAVFALLAAAGGRWVWQRTHVPPASQALHVSLDPSEYLLTGRIDGKGQADVLLLLRVDVATGFADPVRLLRMDGGGIHVGTGHAITGGTTQFAVPAQVSCDQWVDGNGVRAVFQVGTGAGHEVDVPLDAGHNSPVHAQITAPCRLFAATHPLRLSVFSVSFQPTAPILETTWTLVNRSNEPLSLDPAADTTIVGSSQLPLVTVPGGPDQGPTVIAPRQTVSVQRQLEVTSCVNTADLDANGTSIRMVGVGAGSTVGENGKALVDLDGQSVQQVMSVAADVCRGAPDVTGLTTVLHFANGPPGMGTGQLRVDGTVSLAGSWTVRIADTSQLHDALDAVTGRLAQSRTGVGAVSLLATWTVRNCTQLDLPDRPPADVHVTVSSIRTYPFVLPLTVDGQTGCTPDDIRG